MSRTLRVALVCGFAGAVVAQTPVERQVADALRWFDTLGYAKVGDRPFVRVATGAWSQVGKEPPQNTFVHGFLLDSDGRQARVLTVGLAERVFVLTPAHTPEHERVGFEPVPLRQYAERVLAARWDDRVRPPVDFDGSLRDEPRPGHAVSMFVLAWACQQTGDAALAAKLGAVARHEFGDQQGLTLRDQLARDLATCAMWRLVLGFADRNREFAELRAESERFLRHFPDSAHAAEARSTRDVLVRMLQQAAARPALPADADEAARISDLVFRLRDQNGHQWSQPGACDVFADPRGEQSPAAELAAYGYRALPLLLPAFDDDSFTRCVGFHRDFYFSHEVLRVRDVARAVASRIAGSWVPSRAAAERLWREHEAQGERAILVAGTERGNAEHAERLLARHPDAVLPALRTALAARPEPASRRALVGVLAGVPGAEVDALLQAELQRPADLPMRVTAAVALFRRGQREVAVNAMVAAWQEPLDEYGAKQVGAFLATCGAERAVAALATRCERLSGDILSALGSSKASFDRVHLPDGSFGGRMQLGEPDAGTERAIETLLAALLDDRRTLVGSFDNTCDPEVRDFAAAALHERWPHRYVFDFDAPRQVRQRQVLAAKNVWRASQGWPPLPPTPRPNIPAVDRAQVDGLFTRLGLERAEPARERIFAAIEELGLGALPEVVERARATRDTTHRQELQALASRLASRVREVRVAADSAPFPVAVRDLAMAMQEQRLQADALVAVLCAIGSGDARQPATALATVTRADDGTGVVVEFTFAEATRGDGNSVEYSVAVSAGDRNLTHFWGTGGRNVVGDPSRYRRFAEALAEALLAPADQGVDTRFEMTFK